MRDRIVCVLDLDCTLGCYDGRYFVVRPYTDLLIRVLACVPQIDIIIWSMGEDGYVRDQINGYLPLVATHAYKIFGRTTCKLSADRYGGVQKCSQMIRNLYSQNIFLFGVDDKADTVMDEGYDVRITVPEFGATDTKDRHLIKVLEVIFERIHHHTAGCAARLI